MLSLVKSTLPRPGKKASRTTTSTRCPQGKKYHPHAQSVSRTVERELPLSATFHRQQAHPELPRHRSITTAVRFLMERRTRLRALPMMPKHEAILHESRRSREWQQIPRSPPVCTSIVANMAGLSLPAGLSISAAHGQSMRGSVDAGGDPGQPRRKAAAQRRC